MICLYVQYPKSRALKGKRRARDSRDEQELDIKAIMTKPRTSKVYSNDIDEHGVLHEIQNGLGQIALVY